MDLYFKKCGPLQNRYFGVIGIIMFEWIVIMAMRDGMQAVA